MRVVFLSKNPCNSAVVDSANGTLLFQITTPGFRKRRTTMYDQHGNIVGVYQRRFWKSDKITLRGQTRSLSEWMPRRFSCYGSRRLFAPDGRIYTWKKKFWRNSFELVDRHTKRVVAKAQRKRQGTSGLVSKRRMAIDLSPDVVHMVDAIVFSFALWDRLRRQDAASANGVAASS
ncbi:hypothetical protein C8T65DRAFT_581659 [Cerioporus squamosus]|nr:hypothetical protein C8T65DRAFT_581659 [Cerioporus squamosus]